MEWEQLLDLIRLRTNLECAESKGARETLHR